MDVLGGAVPESLSTEVAGVGLVPRVSQHVCLQLVKRYDVLSTITNVSLRLACCQSQKGHVEILAF